MFEDAGIDESKFTIRNMQRIKRSVRKNGRVLGHQAGEAESELLGYREARYEIYLPAYKWVLENRLHAEVEELREKNRDRTVVLLDYETNTDVENLEKPLSHAALVAKYQRPASRLN